MSALDFLVELGTEELPPKALAKLAEAFCAGIEKGLKDAGLLKAPIFAFLIALIGCLEGFKVTGSAQSVGEHTTSSVVQAIFMVILLDAIAALFFMEMGW